MKIFVSFEGIICVYLQAYCFRMYLFVERGYVAFRPPQLRFVAIHSAETNTLGYDCNVLPRAIRILCLSSTLCSRSFLAQLKIYPLLKNAIVTPQIMRMDAYNAKIVSALSMKVPSPASRI